MAWADSQVLKSAEPETLLYTLLQNTYINTYTHKHTHTHTNKQTYTHTHTNTHVFMMSLDGWGMHEVMNSVNPKFSR